MIANFLDLTACLFIIFSILQDTATESFLATEENEAF